MTASSAEPRPTAPSDHPEGRSLMGNNRRLLSLLAAAGATLALAFAAVQPASADPDPGNPGQPPAGKAPNQILSGVGADAFAELTNNIVSTYDAAPPAGTTRVLTSYDAVNPATGATGVGENINPKPGCDTPAIPRPNGANAGITALLANQKSTVDTNEYCIDFVRSSRAKGSAAAEQPLTFYAQSRDAVSYAVVGNAYAPVAPLTTAQLKDIFECTTTDWSEVGGQAGAIHLYLPPASAATFTFFLQAIGSSTTSVNAGCAGLPTVFSAQQNDGTSLKGDPQGILPYAVTKWAAQNNDAPGINDLRGGAHIGPVNTTTSPFTTTSLGGKTYLVLNPAFTSAPSASFGRYFFNVVRPDAPQELKDVFKAGGYLCQHADDFLIPFGNTPLGDDTSQTQYCGKPN
jgi:ABC-type phosphate transport system substrate-binding protein